MRIAEDIKFRGILVDWIAKREFSKREGVHCSDLIYCLNKQAQRRLNPLPPDKHETLLFSIGWATQRWLTGQDKDAATVIKDGIQVTCDALWDVGGDVHIPWELKATFQSSAKPIEENTAWIRQIMAQCYVQNTTETLLTRFEIMGNWKSVFGKKEDKDLPENQKPDLHAYHFVFDQQELEDNWEWLKVRAATFRELLEGRPLLPKMVALPTEQQWECQYCNPTYRAVCEKAQ